MLDERQDIIKELSDLVVKTAGLRDDVKDACKDAFAKTFDLRNIKNKQYITEWIKRVYKPLAENAAKKGFDLGKKAIKKI